MVAEMSANHLGSFSCAMKILEAAAEAGADAIKLQTFTPEQMVGDPNYIVQNGPWHGRRLLSLYQEAHTPREWHAPIFGRCQELGIECFSTPFHLDDVVFLESLGCPRYKISSFEITDLELIAACARTRKPIIISTGMASFNEIGIARETAKWSGSRVTMLKCTSAYPASAADANLATMVAMMGFGPSGLSDHTPGIGVAVAAAALGASVIEKHLTLSRAYGGPDAAFSMEPHEFKQMVTECRRSAAAMGDLEYGPSIAESESVSLRRSLWLASDMKAGETIRREHLKVARPAHGLPADALPIVIGMVMRRDANKGAPLSRDMFQ